jgi:hypothetical protein
MRAALASLASIVTLAAGAEAEPEAPPGSADELPSGTRVDDGYPALHVQRPLLLPAGGVEGAVGVRNEGSRLTGHVTSQTAAEARLRLGLGRVELEAAAALTVAAESPDGFTDAVEPPALGDLGAAARYGLSPDQAIEAELLIDRHPPTGTSYRPSLWYRRKDHLARRAAMVTAIGPRLRHAAQDAGASYSLLELEGRLRVEAQLGAIVMVSTHAVLGGRHELDEPEVTGIDTLYFAVGWDVTLAAARAIDVTVGARVDHTGELQAVTLHLGLIVRRVP